LVLCYDIHGSKVHDLELMAAFSIQQFADTSKVIDPTSMKTDYGLQKPTELPVLDFGFLTVNKKAVLIQCCQVAVVTATLLK
jgi:hypothetical protein